jgi:hypothetical protein
MSRYLSWLALSVAAGFLVVASVGFAAPTVTSLAFGISIVTLIISAGIAYSDRHHTVAALTAVLAAGVSAWTLVASLVFSSPTVQTLAFAGSLAVVGLSLVGLTEHELSHGAEQSSGTRKSPLAAAA